MQSLFRAPNENQFNSSSITTFHEVQPENRYLYMDFGREQKKWKARLLSVCFFCSCIRPYSMMVVTI